jgi:hypothetical protein
MDGQYADISFADMGNSAQLRHAFRLESEKLINRAIHGNPFNIVKTDISKIVGFLGAIF